MLTWHNSVSGCSSIHFRQVPSYTPSGLMGYSPLGSMGHAPPAQVPVPSGHISPDFGAPPAQVSGVVTKQESTFVDCHPPSASGQASGSSQNLDPGRSAVSPATLAEFNQSTSKGHEILSQVKFRKNIMKLTSLTHFHNFANIMCFIFTHIIFETRTSYNAAKLFAVEVVILGSLLVTSFDS